MMPPRFEGQHRADHQIANRSGCHDIVGAAKRADPSGDVDGDAGQAIIQPLAFAGMQARSHRDARRLRKRLNRHRGSNGARRTVEDRDDAVAGGVHELSSAAFDLRPAGGVVVSQDLAPPAISQLHRETGRIDDVRDEDGGQETPGVTTRGLPQNRSDRVDDLLGQHDQARVRDALGRRRMPGGARVPVRKDDAGRAVSALRPPPPRRAAHALGLEREIFESGRLTMLALACPGRPEAAATLGRRADPCRQLLDGHRAEASCRVAQALGTEASSVRGAAGRRRWAGPR
jgi:hypothetical protein